VPFASLPPVRRRLDTTIAIISHSQLPRSDDNVYARPLPIDKPVSLRVPSSPTPIVRVSTPPFSDDGAVAAVVVSVDNIRLCFRCQQKRPIAVVQHAMGELYFVPPSRPASWSFILSFTDAIQPPDDRSLHFNGVLGVPTHCQSGNYQIRPWVDIRPTTLDLYTWPPRNVCGGRCSSLDVVSTLFMVV